MVTAGVIPAEAGVLSGLTPLTATVHPLPALEGVNTAG